MRLSTLTALPSVTLAVLGLTAAQRTVTITEIRYLPTDAPSTTQAVGQGGAEGDITTVVTMEITGAPPTLPAPTQGEGGQNTGAAAPTGTTEAYVDPAMSVTDTATGTGTGSPAETGTDTGTGTGAETGTGTGTGTGTAETSPATATATPAPTATDTAAAGGNDTSVWSTVITGTGSVNQAVLSSVLANATRANSVPVTSPTGATGATGASPSPSPTMQASPAPESGGSVVGPAMALVLVGWAAAMAL